MSEGVSPEHPRYESLWIRERLVRGVEQGITSQHGLIAHGRGEAFDYLFGERTRGFGGAAAYSGVCALMLAEHPVISVNGNAAALVPQELVDLSKHLEAPLEVNLFHAGSGREQRIADHLKAHGALEVLLPDGTAEIPGIESDRRFVNGDGIGSADVVFVPLEDGDRCAALRQTGKDVITVDLNPLSRTAQSATITIVDNVVRALPRMVWMAESLATTDREHLRGGVQAYKNVQALKTAEMALRLGDSPMEAEIGEAFLKVETVIRDRIQSLKDRRKSDGNI